MYPIISISIFHNFIFLFFRIVLDEFVIPKRYARVLLHAVYLDTVDLSLILRGGGCAGSSGSLGEVRNLVYLEYTCFIAIISV